MHSVTVARARADTHHIFYSCRGAGREVEFAICNLCFATYLAQSQSLTTISAHWVFRLL